MVIIKARQMPIKNPIWKTFYVLLLLLLFVTESAYAQSREYKVKAAFLFNFGQFVEWPPGAFPEKQSPLVIGILGTDPFGKVLDEIVRSEQVEGHPLTIQRYRKAEDIGPCHILFISQSEEGRLEEILAALKGRSILTVGDFEGFAKRGGAIRFTTEKSKIRFRINVEAAKASGLTISSKLLRAADIVSPGQD